MEIKQYQAAIEAILFASGEPVPVSRLALALELDEETTRRIAEDWAQDVNTRAGGVTALKLDDQYQLCSSKAYAGYVRKAMDIRRNAPLLQAQANVIGSVSESKKTKLHHSFSSSQSTKTLPPMNSRKIDRFLVRL
jgi:segregation and condensation protein B